MATTKFLAKIASDMAKPDGLLVIEPGAEAAFLDPLPLGRLWGVGPATLGRLEALGVHTVGEVARLPQDALVAALGSAHGSHISQLARNVDARAVTPERVTKSIGNEETFGADVRSRPELEREIVRLSDRVAGRLRHAGVEARTLTLKVRFADFRTITRSRTETAPTALSTEIATIARALLAPVDVAQGIRLIGISGSQLVSPPERQGTLALGVEGSDEGRVRRGALEDAMDAVRDRFGAGALRAGSLVETGSRPREANE